ncbi:MAG: tetratricopeptide repeat protein [Bdellovibrionales bacterium]|nr:tetratricopeptide repeat protein [Bdellovibrionales bacterium]
MAKRKDIEKEAKRPDAFIDAGTKAAKVMEDNKWAILTVFVIVILAAATWVGMEKWQTHQELKAQASLFEIYKDIEKKQEDWDKKKEDSSLTYESVFQPDVEKLESEIKQHRTTVAAQTMAMRLADLLADHEKFDKAVEVLKQVEPSVPQNTWMASLFRLQFSSLLSKVGQTDQAVKELEQVSQSKSSKFLHSEALIKIAVLSEEKGDSEKARELYSQIVLDHPDSEASRLAQARLYLMKLKSQGKETATP